MNMLLTCSLVMTFDTKIQLWGPDTLFLLGKETLNTTVSPMESLIPLTC